ncbi:MAG: efflux RND transporter permease subunit [Candidatus Bipolaricaulia bacterium]
MVERFFLFAYRLARHRAWWVLGGTVLIAALALIYTFVISPLEVRSSFLDLLPQNDELIARFKESQEALERIDYLQILIELRDPPQDETERERLLLGASSRLIAHLKESPEIVAASDRPEVALPELMVLTGGREQLQELLGYVERIEARLPSPSGSGGSGVSLSGEERLSATYSKANEVLEEALTKGEGGAGSGGGFEPEGLVAGLSALQGLTRGVQQTLVILEEPEGLEQDITGLIGALDGLRQKAQEQVFLSSDKTAILVSARPRLSSQAGGVAYCHKVVRLVKQAIAAAGLDKEGFRIGLSGSYAFAAESDQLIKRDMNYTALIATFGLAAIYLLTLGGALFPMLIAIPLFVAMLFTLAWAKLVTGGLNLITSLLPSQILGWGDYGVHLIARYLEERKRRLRIGPALKETFLAKGLPTAIGGITTTIAILTLLFGRSRGIFEMGIVFSFGILLTLALTIFLLPALVVLSHFVFRRTFRKRHRFQLKFDRLIPWVFRRRGPIILATIILSLALVFPAARVRFQFVSQELLPQKMGGQLVRQEIQEKGFNLEQLKLGDYFIFFAKDEAELERITAGLRQMALVESVDSLANYLTPELQVEGLSLSGGITAGRQQLELIRSSLGEREEIKEEAQRLIVNLSSLQALATLSGRGELAKEVSALIAGLLDLIGSLERARPEALATAITSLEGELNRLAAKLAETFPSGDPFAIAQALLQEWFRTPKGDFIIYAKVDSSKIYQPEYYRRFIEEASQFSRAYFGAAMIQDRLERYMKRDFWVTTAISAALMLAILLWDFRRRGERHYAPLAMLPLILGYLWMLGGMRLLGLAFNFTNILISPLLIGLGIDNGVHIIHGYLERRKTGETLASTALAIFITSSTTLVSFAALLLARTPGLRLLGESALLGLGFNTIFSLTFLPALLAERTGSRSRSD